MKKRKKQSVSPTARVSAYLRKQGHIVGRTERWESHAGEKQWDPKTRKYVRQGVRIDLFGFIDLIALNVQKARIVAIQVTSETNHKKRVNKIIQYCSDNARAWIRCNGCIEVWSPVKYSITAKTGKRLPRWRFKKTIVDQFMLVKTHKIGDNNDT